MAFNLGMKVRNVDLCMGKQIILDGRFDDLDFDARSQ